MATPSIYSYTILDDNGVKATAPFYYIAAAGSTLTQQNAEWVALGALLDAVTGGVIIGGHVSTPLPPDAGWKDTPVAGSDVSDVLNLNYANLSNLYKFGLIVPMLRTALISGGRPIIASGAIKDLSDHILAGTVTPALAYTNTGGNDLSALVDAFQSDRKHRRQLKANSTVRP